MCYLFLQSHFWTHLTIVMIYGFLYFKLLLNVGAFHLVPNIVIVISLLKEHHLRISLGILQHDFKLVNQFLKPGPI